MKLKLTIEGKVYEVDVEATESERRQPAYVPPQSAGRATGGSVGPTAAPPGRKSDVVADESKVCRSPISGVVVRVSAQVGQEIRANDVLMVLEAMKMETEITSPIDGKIAQVNAAPGDAVKGGQVLVEFE